MINVKTQPRSSRHICSSSKGQLTHLAGDMCTVACCARAICTRQRQSQQCEQDQHRCPGVLRPTPVASFES